MNWKKVGLIFVPDKKFSWMQSHAQLPVADYVKGDTYNIYYASRNSDNYSSIGSFSIDLNHPKKILSFTEKPLLSPGNTGYFDEHGVYPSSVVTVGKRKLLYYIGWNKGYKEPLFYSSIGIAQSDDNGKSFRKIFNYPIMARGEHDPCLVTSPFVYKEGKRWSMIYVSGFKWSEYEGTLQSYYDLKYAYSTDGIHWQREGKKVIALSSPYETNIGRASVIKENGIYMMWFCYVKGKPYRIGYAESSNGVDWERADKMAGINVSKKGFDDEMISYPYVFLHKRRKYMLYNGNYNGRAGIGMAYLDNE